MNGEVFCHWAKEPFEFSRDISRYDEKRAMELMKPAGFWFDVDGDWHRWCSLENFRWAHLEVPHEVIVDEGRILRLSHPYELDMFTEKYTKGPMMEISRLDGEKWDMNHNNMYMDWERVAKECAGLIIAPYCWERRMEYMWYYGWDCASGVVWDLNAVISCKPNLNLKDKFVEIP